MVETFECMFGGEYGDEYGRRYGRVYAQNGRRHVRSMVEVMVQTCLDPSKYRVSIEVAGEMLERGASVVLRLVGRMLESLIAWSRRCTTRRYETAQNETLYARD